MQGFAGPDLEQAVFYPEDDRFRIERDPMGYLGMWSALRSLEASEDLGPFRDLQRSLSSAWGDPSSSRKVV